MNPQGVIRFEGWTLQIATGELTREGVSTRLQTQPCAVLVMLLERPGELVTREELIARLWPRGVVDFDTALNSAVRRLRTALGEQADQPRYIETIPKRGYRYIGRLDVAPALPASVARTESPVDEADSARVPASPALPLAPPPRAARLRWVAAAALAMLCATASVVGASRMLDRPRSPVAAVSAQELERLTRAEYFLKRRSEGDLELALRDFHAAIEVEPTLARAWSGLASALWLDTMERGGNVRPGLEQVRMAAERALELDAGQAEPHLRLVNYYCATGRRDRAQQHLRTALEIEPRNALALSFAASDAASRGDFDAAIEQQRRAIEIEPLSTSSRYNLVSWLLLAGRPAEARVEWARLNEIHPGHRDSDAMLGIALILERRYDDALAGSAGLPEGPARWQVEALAYHGLGRDAESDAALQKLIDAFRDQEPVRIAEVYAYRGKPELAFEWLDAAADAPQDPKCVRAECVALSFAEHSPFLKPLHDDGRWQAWVTRVNDLNGHSG